MGHESISGAPPESEMRELHSAERQMPAARVRAEVARAATSMPATSVGRAARAVLGEFSRRLCQLGDGELVLDCRACRPRKDDCCWRRALDVGVSYEILRAALALVARATGLLERVGLRGRQVVYKARLGAALRGWCLDAELNAEAAVHTAEVDVPGGWRHPDLLICAPRAVQARHQLGEADEAAGVSGFRRDERPVSPQMSAYLRHFGVVRPDLLTHNAARMLAAVLRQRPWLLRRRRQEAGFQPGEQHHVDYPARVAATAPRWQWIDEDRELARDSKAGRRIEAYRVRSAVACAAESAPLPVTLVERGLKRLRGADGERGASRPRAQDGRFGEAIAPGGLQRHAEALPALRKKHQQARAMDVVAAGADTPYMRALARAGAP